LKKQSQSNIVQGSAFSGLRVRIRKGNLKKQTQFPGVLMSVTSFQARNYDGLAALRPRKNKADQSQLIIVQRSAFSGQRIAEISRPGDQDAGNQQTGESGKDHTGNPIL
jgi:hypothetical protein